MRLSAGVGDPVDPPGSPRVGCGIRGVFKVCSAKATRNHCETSIAKNYQWLELVNLFSICIHFLHWSAATCVRFAPDVLPMQPIYLI